MTNIIALINTPEHSGSLTPGLFKNASACGREQSTAFRQNNRHFKMKNSIFIFIFFPPSSPNFGRTMFVKQGNKKKRPN